jgi:hypothetical protein
MRAFLATLVLAMAALVGFSSPASAEWCGASSNGCDAAFSHTDCAGAGAFGAFGDKFDVYHDFRGGADGTQTGINNSNLCGRPQGATAN